MAGRARVFRTSPTAKASLFLTDNAASLIGDSRHFVTADERGVTIKGPVSFINDAMSRRTGGLFVGINDFLDIIPSTIVTPLPRRIPFPPIFAMVNLTRDIAFFMSLLV